MKRKTKQQVACLLTLALTFGLCQSEGTVSAATVKLNKKTVSVTVGKTATIKLKGTKKKAKWTIKSGKKYITLKAKKKASVKVYGVRKGTAKVLCKAGKKKLICKVTVKSSKKPTVTAIPKESSNPATPTASTMPTVTPTVEPTPVPTHPFEAYEMITLQTPGPVAEYDRLKVETVLCKKRVVMFDGATMMYGERFFETDIERSDIEKITLTDTAIVPADVLGTIDVSEKGNGSVMAWYVDEDNDGYYEMTIGQDGGVVANENSAYLFCDVGSSYDQQENTVIVEGLENLNTSHVTDMSYMFADCGAYVMTTLDFKDGIDVSHVTQMEGMFFNAGNTQELRCYTTNATLRQWLIENAETCLWRTPDLGVGSEYEGANDVYIIYGSPNEVTRPTHPPTTDYLMEEPVAVLTESGTVETFSAEELIGEAPAKMYFFGSDILREDIEFVTISDTTEVPDDVLGTMDISNAQNGSILAWYTDKDEDGDYEMTIGQDGGVVLNRNSSYLFYGIGRNAPTDHADGELFTGFDKLYNGDILFHSYYMFAYCGDSTGSFKKLDLGAFFDRGFTCLDNIKMFWHCGDLETTKFYMQSDFMYDLSYNAGNMFGNKRIPKSENLISAY